ncbi:unnamed protein product [Caenorhabditis sp. 36 PRJEB53466]|nr:unnamed protein product [Caenorhabditis sp. 36 PRJEB53466]
MLSRSFPLLSLLLSTVSSYNFLIVNPIYGYSHAKYLGKLADVLADAGHKVTVFQHYHTVFKNSDKYVKNKNVEILNYFPDKYEEMLKKEARTFPDFWDSPMMTNVVLSSFVMPDLLRKEFEKESTRVLKDKDLHQQLKDKKFDAVIVETFESSGFYLAHLIGVIPIATMSSVRHPSQSLFGQPSILGYVPGEGSNLPPNAGFLDRLNDVYTKLFVSRMFHGLFEEQHKVYAAAIGGDVPHWEELVKRSPIFLTNGNPYLDFAVPSPGNIVQIEYEKILEERDSTVLVSFGSVMRSYQMPPKFKAGVIKMFENLPDVTFIWKYEIDDEELQKRLPSNVHLKKWVPQPALLADKRVKVFVTHGGLGSTMEVAHSGKPALMIPLFGDQPLNAQMLARHGGAVAYNKYELPNGEKLTATMRDMVHSPKYKEHAEELKHVLESQPIDPKETFLKHVEFAVKFPHFKSQIPEISGSGLIGFYYLDVIFFFSVILLISLYLIVKLTLRIVRRFATVQSRKSRTE